MKEHEAETISHAIDQALTDLFWYEDGADEGVYRSDVLDDAIGQLKHIQSRMLPELIDRPKKLVPHLNGDVLTIREDGE